MTLPAYVTSENVKFDGTTQHAVVLKNASGVRSLILWDNLSVADQTLLDALITAYGGATPLAGPTAGSLTADFKGTVVGANATGLQNVSAATAGFATVNVGGAQVGTNPTGLSTVVGTAGYQNVEFKTQITGAGASGLTNDVPATSGHQTVNVGGAATGATATGLPNDASTHTASISIDGTPHAVSITGSTAQTYTTLLSGINTAIGAAGTATLSGGNILITSASTGSTSTVAITDTSLFNALTGYVAINTAVAGTNTVVTTYTATVTVDGVAKPVSFGGGTAQTFTNVVAQLNSALGASATAAVVNGHIQITSATFGASSSVSITTPGTLFPALANFMAIEPPVKGKATGRQYSASVIVDGVVKTVSFTGVQGNTYTNLLTEINNDLGSAATATLSGGNIVITSATTGLASSVVIMDTGFLFSSLTNYAGFSSTAGTAPRTYTATITVDGVVKNISVQGSAAQTFTTLVSAINTGLGVSATAAITGGNIVITSATTGASSSVVAGNGDLFKNLTGFFGWKQAQAGAADLLTVLQNTRMPSGCTYAQHFVVQTVGTKPAVPIGVVHSPKFAYYDTTVSKWKYLDDDTLINA